MVSRPYFLFVPIAGWSSDTPNVDGVVVNILVKPKIEPVEINLGEIIFNTPAGKTITPASYLEHFEKAGIICNSTLGRA